MPQQLKIFKGAGMNLDDATESLDPSDTRENYNVRFTGTTEGEGNDASNIESTALITGSLGTGINQGVGGTGFEVIRTGYQFIYNSALFHQITKLDYDAKTQTVLYTNLTDSSNENILSLDPQYYINDQKIINDIYQAWTDRNMQPCLVDMERLESGDYGTMTLAKFLIIKAQCLIPPTAEYGDDAGQSVNLLQGKLFQFRVQYEYKGYYQSAGSTWSKRPVPVSEATPSVGTDVSKNNNLTVSVDIGTDEVQKVTVWAHYSNYDWFVIKEASRDYILALPSAINIPQEVYEAYDPVTNLYSLVFYNDGSYPDVDPVEADLDYDHVPLKCESAEVIGGALLALGGITEGYERPEVDATLSISSYAPDVSTSAPVTGLTVASVSQYRLTGTHKRAVTVTYAGTAHTGDVLTTVVQDIRDANITTTYTYTVPVSQDGNTNAALLSFASVIPGAAYKSSTKALTFVTASYFQLLSANVTVAGATTGLIKSIAALKDNSSYQVALAHMDAWGRYFPLVTGVDYILNTPSYAQSHGQSPQINWQLNSDPPEGAVSAQWLLTKNNTHETSLYVDVVLDEEATNQSPGYFVFNMNPLRQFNAINSSSILSYEFTPGDRCTFAFYYSSGTTTVWFDNPAVDVEVAGFEINETGNYILKVKKSDYLAYGTILNKNVMIELYTPRLRATDGTPTPQLFYEVGEEISITNGAYDVTAGTITDGDAYFKIRQYVGAVDPNVTYSFKVEDFNYSDFYASAYTSYGRSRAYNDEVGRVERKGCIRYSDVFRRGSFVNGLNRFYPENVYGERDGETSANYGWIRKIVMRGNVLIALQELEVAYIPVSTAIVEDQSASDQYALSLKVLNNCRYSGLGYGIGNAVESFAKWGWDIYFFDPNRSEPIRDGRDGLQIISGKMSMFFKRVVQAAYAQGKKLIGYYDIFYKEYLLSIQTFGDIVVNVPFTPSNWQFDNQYVVAAGDISLDSQGTKTTTTYNNTTGIATVTADPGETGADRFTFKFMDGADEIVVGACGTIIAGGTDVDAFDFLDITGAEINTVYVSNSILVTGNTIPVAISITGGQYRIDGGSWTSVAGLVSPLSTVEVRQLSSASYNTQTDVVLTVSTQMATYSVTTKDITPDPFVFVDVVDATLSTVYESNIVTITGITGLVPISVIGGEYRINGGTYTSSAGTITNGQTAQVRVTSSAGYSTPVNAPLTVGTYSDTYTVTTEAGGAADAAESTLLPLTSNIAADGTSTQVLTVQAKTAGGVNIGTGGATVTITQDSGTGSISAVTDNMDGTYTATVTSAASPGSGVFVATLNGSDVQNGGVSQTEATVTYDAIVSKDIAWSNTPDLSPYVSASFAYYLEGVLQWVVDGVDSGTITVNSGSLVKFVQVGNAVRDRWPEDDEEGSEATMTVMNGMTELYDGTATAQVEELNSYEFIVDAAGDYSVDMVSSSTVTGLATYTATAESTETDVQVRLRDETTFNTELNVVEIQASPTGYLFNVVSDANTITAFFTNLSGVTITATVDGVGSVNINHGDTDSIGSIPKGNITITVVEM